MSEENLLPSPGPPGVTTEKTPRTHPPPDTLTDSRTSDLHRSSPSLPGTTAKPTAEHTAGNSSLNNSNGAGRGAQLSSNIDTTTLTTVFTILAAECAAKAAAKSSPAALTVLKFCSNILNSCTRTSATFSERELERMMIWEFTGLGSEEAAFFASLIASGSIGADDLIGHLEELEAFAPPSPPTQPIDPIEPRDLLELCKGNMSEGHPERHLGSGTRFLDSFWTAFRFNYFCCFRASLQVTFRTDVLVEIPTVRAPQTRLPHGK